MGETTGIAWCDHTFNPWMGCVHAGPECDFCYAELRANRYPRTRGLWGKDAGRLPTGDAYWKQPDAWNNRAAKNGRRARVFCGSMCDVLERGVALDALRARLWPIIERTTWLDWLLLTKRPDGYRDLVPAKWHHPGPWPSNVWAGTTCGTSAGLARVRTLCEAAQKAPLRFVSCEPMLEAIDFANVIDPNYAPAVFGRRVNWIIFGGESGHHARPTDLAWIRSGVEQCREFTVTPFVKQLGAQPFDSGLTVTGRSELVKLKDRAGADPMEWPEDLRIQEFPR